MSNAVDISSLNGSVSRIYNNPMTSHALDLLELFRKNSLDREGLHSFLKTLPKDTSEEVKKLEEVINDSSKEPAPNLSSRANQLVWAAGLGYLHQNSAVNLRSHPIWNSLTTHPKLLTSFRTTATVIDNSIKNSKTTMDWGMPGSWFYNNPENNHINIDLFHTLVLGFDDKTSEEKSLAHATGIMMHEVGHSQLTTKFTNKMISLFERQKEIIEASKTRALSEEEFKELSRVKMEFSLRHSIFNSAEDNCVNQYAVNCGKTLSYDFKEALNICNVLLQGTGYDIRKKEKPALNENELEKTIEDLLKNQDSDKVANARRDFNNLVTAIMLSFYGSNGLFDVKDKQAWKALGVDPEAIKSISNNADDFEHLLDLNIGGKGMANLQPQPRDTWLLRTMFEKAVHDYANKRLDIIDFIWDNYASQYADILIHAAEQKAQEKMEKKKTQDSKGGKTPPDNTEVEVDGVGKLDAGKEIPQSPKDASKSNRAPSEDSVSEENKKTVKEIAKEAKNNGKDNNDDNTQDNLPKPDDLKQPSQASKSGREKGIDLRSLAKGDWRELRKRLNELEPIINKVAEDFIYIREQQKRIETTLSPEMEQLPRGGDIRERLDMRAHTNFAIKRATGQKIERRDLNRWHKDKITTEPTSVELWILCDGSGSMNMKEHGAPIEPAVQSMAILHEAGKRAGFDVFAGMWGDDNIRMLAAPGYSDQKIGENFERAKNGINSGTQLSPAFIEAIEHSSKQENDKFGKVKKTAGMTHFLILSDGELDFNNIEPTVDAITKLFKYGPDVSVDIAVLGTGEEMDSVVLQIKRLNPSAKIDIIKATTSKEIPVLLSQKIKRRFETSGKPVKAVPDQNKRDAFKRVHSSITRK